MKRSTKKLVERWFEGLNRGDLESLLGLFSSHPTIRNAANPQLLGGSAPRRLLEDFFNRTCERHFDQVEVAEGDGQIFASWVGTLTFAEGVEIAGVALPRPISVTIRGAERFLLDSEGLIQEVDIFHETTSVAKAAREAA